MNSEDRKRVEEARRVFAERVGDAVYGKCQQCELRKGHSGTEVLEKEIALQRERNREMRARLDAVEARLNEAASTVSRLWSGLYCGPRVYGGAAGPVPASERIVVSEWATLAYWWAACPVHAPIGELPKTVDVPAGLRAAFKVMLAEALSARFGERHLVLSQGNVELYRAITGEEWPG